KLDAKFNGNVYHLTFDKYFSDDFLPSLKEMGLKEKFAGFTFYENARSNYLITRMSVASYTTGRLFAGHKGMKKWLRQTKFKTILQTLKKAGFTTTFYSPYNHRWFFLAEKLIKGMPFSLLNVADLWLLRTVPTILRQEVYSTGKGIFTKIHDLFDLAPSGDIRSYRALKQFEHLLVTEELRSSAGEYIHGHFMLPHGPTILMRTGEYDPKRSNYKEQALLATKLMADLIRRLKE
ncbi:unnamed protein product, partial [marine sediment metagenome]